MGDFGREQAQGSEALVFAEGIFALKNAGVEAGVLQGDGTERSKGGEKTFFVVVEAVQSFGEDGEHAEHFAFVKQRSRQDGD